MMRSELEASYETARRWSVQPVSHPPPGWAQIVRGGLAAWIQAAPPLSAGAAFSLQASPVDVSPLLTLVAAMIAEVCQ
jgi:hypothetical protein